MCILDLGKVRGCILVVHIFLRSSYTKKMQQDNNVSGELAFGIFGEVGWGGAAGLLAELSRILEGGGCEWLDEEIRPGVINREQRAREAREETTDEPGLCTDIYAVPTMQEVPKKRGHNRRYTGGARCVYCVWFGPDSSEYGDGRCEHVKRAVDEWQQQESPSILPGSLLQIVRDGLNGKHTSEYITQGSRVFASYMRWPRAHRRTGGGGGPQKVGVVSQIQATQVQSRINAQQRL